MARTAYTRYAKCSAYALLLLLGVGLACPALASGNPFDLDSGGWMSYNHYDDDAVRHPPPTEPEKPVAAVTITPPVMPIVHEPAPAAAPEMPSLPALTFITPTMPGLTKGFEVKINSTEEETKTNASSSPDTPLDIRPPEKNWESPSAKKNAAKDTDEENTALSVRMSYLPTRNLAPVPEPDHPSAVKLGHEMQRRKLAQKKQEAAVAKTPEVAAACAAMEVYKKQQLDAIQSDRETLLALQNAIHSLGLTKQLGFMTGSEDAAPTENKQSFAPISAEPKQ